jgi:DNA-directed RNA polymerase subunit RPC12/RpoP
MSQEIVRCPYCVLDSEFRPMLQRSQTSFVCSTCGHMAIPDEPHVKCSCARCRELVRLANRISRDERPNLAQAAGS